MPRSRPSPVAWLFWIGLALAGPSSAGLVLAGQRAGGTGALVAADRGAAAVLVVAAIGWSALLVALALFVFLPTRSPEQAARTAASYRTMLAMLAIAAIPGNGIGLAYVLLTGRPDGGRGLSAGTLNVAIFALELSLLAVLYFRIVRPGVLSWRALGFTGEKLGSHALVGLATGAGLIVMLVLEQLILRALGVEQTQAQTYEGIRGAPPWQFVVLFVGAALLAPIAEEAFFRGYVFGVCLGHKGAWRAYLFSAGLFAAVHFNLPALLPIFTIGLGFAFVYARTRSLVPSIVAHGLNNGLAMSVLFFGPALAA